MASIPSIKYTAKDFASIDSELSAFVQATRPDDWNDFFQSSLGTALIELVCFSHDILSYSQDAVAQESFLDTARRYDSALKFAKSVGYIPSMAKSASVVATCNPLPGAVTTSGATLSAGQTITGLNGLAYELVEDAEIVASSSTVALTLSEGATVTETFTPTQEMWQTFTTSAKSVEEASFSLYVGDINISSSIWLQTDALALETTASKTFEADSDEDGKLILRFGDGVTGKVPDDTITAVFRTCNGSTGNASEKTIIGSMLATINGGTTTASIDLTNLTRATGGEDRESVESLRRSVPAYLRTTDKVITLDDYERLVPIKTAVGLVFADVPLASTSGNIVRVNSWDKTSTSFTSGSVSTTRGSTETYNAYSQINSTRANEVQAFLSTRTISSVHNIVTLPTASSVTLQWNSIKYDNNYDATTVHSDVTKAIIGVFEDGSGFRVSLSDLYSAVLGVDGVQEATLSKIVYVHYNWDNNTASPPTVTETYTALGTEAGVDGALRDITVPRVEDRQYYDSTFQYTGEITYQDSVDNVNVQAINLTSLSFDLTI